MDRFARRLKPQLEQLEGRVLMSAGNLDPTFGTGGVAIVSFPEPAAAEADLVQPDGKVVLAGGMQTGSDPESNTSSLVLARLLTNGSPDPSFGSGGQVTSLTGVGPVSLALQNDGKILAAATVHESSTNAFEITVTRFLPTGSLDTEFGSNGTVTLPNVAGIASVALQPDGKILIAGTTTSVGAANDSLALIRLNADGTFDSSFGNGGRVDTLSSAEPTQEAIGVGLQPDGRIIVGASGNSAVTLTRYEPNGGLDSSFGAGGVETLSSYYASSMTLYPDGRILITGGPQPSPSTDGESAVLRFSANGVLDSGFGSGGIASFQMNEFVNSVALDASGRIFLGGASLMEAEASNILVACLNPDGSKDVSFGFDGVSIDGIAHKVPGGTSASDVAVQANGQVVAAADADGAFAAVRYTTDDPLPSANQRFVAQIYLDLLSRPAESVALSGWGSILDQGVPRQVVTLLVEASPEFTADRVRFFYSTYLHRQPDSQGLAAWASYLEAGGTNVGLSAFLVSSPEFRLGLGKGTNDGFLDALYQNALNRAVDSATRSLWNQFLEAGGTAAQVAGAIFSSAEYRFDVVELGYTSFLRRVGDLSGVVNFTNALAGGASDALYFSVLLGSEEYFQRVR